MQQIKRIVMGLTALLALTLTAEGQTLENGDSYYSGYIKKNDGRFAQWMTEDGVLYLDYGGVSTLVKYPAEKTDASFTVPSHVSRIARGAFRGARHLKTLVMSMSVMYVGDNAFDDSGIEQFEVSSTNGMAKPSADTRSASSSAKRYNLQGQPLDEPQRGVNIVRSESGEVRKELVK